MRGLSKKILTALAVLMTAFLLSAQGEAARKSVAIMPLENVSGYTAANIAQIMTEELMVAIQGSGTYTVVERAQMGAVIREQGFQNIAADPSEAVEMGKMSGANYTVVGKVTMATATQNAAAGLLGGILGQTKLGGLGLEKFANGIKASVALDVRFVDNKTGEVIFAQNFKGTKTGQNVDMALHAACQVAAANFLKSLHSVNPFVARIAEINGDEFYIDEGSDSGLKQGEKVIVAREGSPIIIKGKIVGMKSVTVCEAVVIEVNPDYAVCKATKSAAGIRAGDIVKRK